MAEEDYPRAATGTILDVNYLPIPGGEQIEARIILKGSPLLATWRKEPVHHSTDPELRWEPEDCIYCQQCHLVCKHGCLHLGDDGLEINQDTCTACGDCIRECPSSALEILGETTTASDLLHNILRRNYAIAKKITRVTISGGEPGLQTAFCTDLLNQFSIADKITVLETCGQVPFEKLRPLLDRPAVLKYELITMDNNLHRQLTGYGNRQILHNLNLVAAKIPPHTRLVVRTPLIRDRTAVQGQINAIGNWVAKTFLRPLPGWELFVPKTACEDIAPFTTTELGQMKKWALEAYPQDNITISNHMGLAYDSNAL